MENLDIGAQVKQGPGQLIGYRRVSSKGQNLDRQELPQCDRVFEEKISGATTHRPALQEMLRFVRDGDTVVVYSIDRLARSLKDLEQIVDSLVAKGVAVKFISENLTFSQKSEDAAGRLMLQVLGAIGQFERSLLRARQAEGIEKAKARGAYAKSGRPRKVDVEWVRQTWTNNPDLSIKEIATELSYSTSSVHRALADFEPYKRADKRPSPKQVLQGPEFNPL
jgi:DNA invertase Pin-like site-specific DNA recombinase